MSEATFDSATGSWLQKATAAVLAAGPSRPMNAKPVPQSESYNTGELLPESMLDAEYELARRQFIIREASKENLIRTGAADAVVGTGKKGRTQSFA
jgi:hypothetical protein